jgi:uncharacterized membrane protein
MLCAVVALVLGCSSNAVPGDAGATCAFVDPSCTTPTPSYAVVIKPVISDTCTACHYPNSPLAQTSLTTYADVHGELGAALTQVSSCLMPPPSYPQPTPAERAALLTWLACGAPEN